MTRLLRVISGSDSSPSVDFTDDVEWTRSEFEGAAHNGESGVSHFTLYDPDGRIPDYVGAGEFLNSHNVVTVDDGPYRLYRGRIGTREVGRGTRRGRRTRTWEVQCSDYNQDLLGIVVNNWVRGSESDQARVQALVTAYLTGSPRATTSLNGTTYVSGSNLTTLAAKTYSGVTPDDIMREIADIAGKVYFVTVDGQIFYDGTESTAYASTLRISDDPADANATTYAPSWEYGASSQEDGIEQLTALRSYYGDNLSVRVTNTLAAQTDYWEGVIWDSAAVTTDEATDTASHTLEVQAEDHITNTCQIGPIPWAQLGSIKWGQTIQIKARAARGGRNPDASYIGDSFVTRRIASLRWKMPAPDTYFALLRLAKPPKTRRFRRGNEALVQRPSLAGAGCTPVCTEDFSNRTVTGGWGSSQFCPVWSESHTVVGGAWATSVIQVTAGDGLIQSVGTTDVNQWSWVDMAAIPRPFEVLARIQVRWNYDSRGWSGQLTLDGEPDPPSSSDWALVTFEATANASPPHTWTFFSRLETTAQGDGATQVNHGTVGVTLASATFLTYEFNIRLRIETGRARYRLWSAFGTEPAAWTATDEVVGSPPTYGALPLKSIGIFGAMKTSDGVSHSEMRVRSIQITEGCTFLPLLTTYGDT